METITLVVFNEPYDHWQNYPRDTLWDTYLKIIVKGAAKKIEYSEY